ncbi:MAG TPA: glycosyltransferase family 1 protein [Treponema sp.]|nr:glycosyltransferase family 1 protein [Treponema sp.]
MSSKKRKLVLINGESWCHNMTGIERTAVEVTKFLDTLVSPGEVELVVPSNAENLPALKNISIVTLNHEAHFFPKWTQIHFQSYVIKRHGISLDFSNTCPFFKPGIEYLHDIYCRLYPKDFVTRRDKLIRLYSGIMYRTIAKRAKRIITVSEYSKKTIVDSYHINPDRVTVVYSGTCDYKKLEPDFSIFDRIKGLREKEFYFTLGSLSMRKNLKWIARHAEMYPDEIFAISGKPLSNVVPPELESLSHLPNVVMTGYLSDSEVKAMLTRCRAFIFPSYFEGFGIPPLEALSCGTPVIISNSSCLPEIYGDCAHYIDPDDPGVNLEALLSEPVESPERLIEKYTLENSARKIYEVIEEIRRN